MSTKTAPPLDEALTRLWRQSRFTSYFYQFTDMVPESTVPTLAMTIANRRFRLYYNPEFVRTLLPDPLVGLLVHEMLHVVLNHSHRALPGQDPVLRNLAQDMVINSYISEHEKTFFSRKGFQEIPILNLPPGLPRVPLECCRTCAGRGLLDVTWEQVYAWLAQRKNTPLPDENSLDAKGHPTQWDADQFKPGSDGEPGLPEGLLFTEGKGKPLPTGIHIMGTPEANTQAEAGKKRVMRFIQQAGQCQDERLYSELSSLIREPNPSRASWKNRLKNMVDQANVSTCWDHSWSRLNRRYFDAGIYAPGRVYRPRPLVWVAVDVSGSMTCRPHQLENAFGVVEKLAETYRISLICLDQDLFIPRKKDGVFVRSSDERPYYYRKGDWKCIRSGARGATFFAPLFNTHLKGHREALVVLTDGYIYDLDSLTPYGPTFWVVPENRKDVFVPPFGKVVAMEGVS